MNLLSFRFVLINCITAVLLVFAAPNYIELNQAYNRDGSSFLLGLFLYLVIWIGLISSIFRSYDLAYHSNNKLTVFEQIFLFIIYFFGWGTTIVFTTIATNLMTTDKMMQIRLFLLLVFPSFILLVLESFFLSNRPNKALNKALATFGRIGNAIYASLGITVCWTSIYIGDSSSFQYSVFNFFSSALLMLFLVFPFQRLFWYEVMSHSNEKMDQLKVIGAIVLVILCGVLPRYFY